MKQTSVYNKKRIEYIPVLPLAGDIGYDEWHNMKMSVTLILFVKTFFDPINTRLEST